jgi:hypothetical protein
MRMESFQPSDELPELRKSKNPEKNKHPDYLVQAKLMARSPLPPGDWVERYAARFRKLYDTDETFREKVQEEDIDGNLKDIQERLDEHGDARRD